MFSASKATLYVQLSPNRLVVRNVKTGTTFSESPDVAIEQKPKPKIIGFGADARLNFSGPNVAIINPFGHPRSIVSDLTVAERFLKLVFRRVLGRSLLVGAPTVFMHPLGDPVGGLTQVEYRALHEMAWRAGARWAAVWQGRPLTDQEILSRSFSSGEDQIWLLRKRRYWD